MSVTPELLTKLALTHPQLTPLRLQRLKNALADEGNSASLDWEAWSPPLAAGSRGVQALAALGLSSSVMRSRDVSATRQILARNTLSSAQTERVTRMERARLEHAKMQRYKPGEARGLTAQNAAVTAQKEPRDAKRRY